MSAHQPQAAARRKLLAAARLAAPAFARNGKPLPRAFFMTDPNRTPDPVRIAENLPREFGVIYRHFGAANRLSLARDLAAICRRRGLVLLVAADPALAIRVSAHGVHWPNRLLRRVRLRRTGWPDWIETASAHSPRELARARTACVDAAILSAVFASDSPSAAAPIGPLRFARITSAAPLPVYALGGVTADNAARAMTHGKAAGWAAIGAIAQAWGGEI